LGLEDSTIAAARAGRLADLQPEQALAVQLAERLTLTPSEVDDQFYGRLVEAFGHAALVELSSAIAWKNYLARFNRVFAVPSDEYPDA
jgi:alkylhydroperoxidase family enzyme